MRIVWLLLLFAFAVGSVWMLWMLISHPNTSLEPVHTFRYNLSTQRLEYTGADSVAHASYNCSAVLKEDKEALEKAKLLTEDKQFLKAAQIPDESYTDATRDCRCAALHYRF